MEPTEADGTKADATDTAAAAASDAATSDALARSEARFRLQADAMPQMVWATDPGGSHLYFNRRWYEYTGQTVEESLGFGFALALHPDDLERTLEQWRRAWEDGENYEIEYRFRHHDGGYRWFVGRAEPVRDPDTGDVTMWAGTCTDIDDLKRAEDTLREQGEFLRRILESSPDCICTLDFDGSLIAMTEAGQRLMEVDDFAVIAGADWLSFWDSGHHRERARAALETAKSGGTGHFQEPGRTRQGKLRWWDVVVSPILGSGGAAEQLLVISRDITEQKQTEQRERDRLSEIFERAPAFMAALRGPQHVFEMANPPYYQLIGHRELIGKPVADAVPETVGQGFIALLDRVYQTGEPFTGADISIRLQREPGGPLEERFLDFTYQPLFGDDGTVSGILAHGIDLTDRRRLERERERLFAETRLVAERESLLNKIGAAVRATLDPEAILRSAVAALGEGLGADRCYFVRYDQTRDIAIVTPEWFRDDTGLEPLAARPFQMSRYSVDRDPAYKAGTTQVVADVVAFAPEDSEPLLSLSIRSLLRVPIEVGDHMTAICVAMADAPRQWSETEIRLLENVAALLHSALESALSQQRERRIAEKLQAALHPPPPADLPGLQLASHYRPALNEASVGGDFFDVFAIGKGGTALVVADLSGKGLAAAQQVSTVRNMLRYALYNSESVARAVTDLHRTLVENNLLTGFATLFVGRYDHAQRTITYVNCGQEPGLICHAATGTFTQMLPTGPVLGGFETAADGSGGFDQKTITLAPGDVIALFTDGLTEMGPSRRNLLEIEGVIELVRACCHDTPAPQLTPQTVVDYLIEGVDKFGQDGIRDDIALLVGLAA